MVWKDVTDPAMLAEHVVWLVPRLVAALLRWDKGTLIGFSSALRRLPRAVRARAAVRSGFRRSDREVLRLVSQLAIDATGLRPG